MRISWREVLGLLIGLAICYGVFYYAVTYMPQIREAVSKQTQKEDAQRGETEQQRTDPTALEEDTKTVIVRVTGSNGEPFGANFGNLRSSRSVEGVAPADYEVRVNTEPRSGDYVSATVWKTTGNSKEIKVQIVEDGRAVSENSTTEDYGATGARWSPNEQQSGGTTTPSTKKAGEDTRPQP